MEKKNARLTRRQRLAAQQASAPKGSTTDAPKAGQPWWHRIHGFSGRTALGAVGLGLMVAVSYLPTLWAGFVWDDVIFSEEPVLREWSGLWSIWFDPADIKQEGHYWPIVYSSFWLEHKLWGLAPLGYHLVNVVLHLVNSLLVWRLLSRLAVPGAWAVAAVFAVHPLHVESVAWIIERKDLLSGMFYLGAVLTWIGFVESPGWRRYGLALALFCAGMLSKSVVVTLPAALLIWHGWQRDRVTSTDLLRLLPFLVAGLAIAAGDYSFYNSREPLSLGYSFAERILIASRALWFYVGKLVWPADLAVIYPLWNIRIGDPGAWAYVAAAAALAALLWFGRHRMGRGPLAGALFFAVTLSPVLGFVDYGYMQFSFVADRFQYLAGIGVMAVLVGGAAWGVRRLPDAFRIGAQGLLAAVLALLGALTWTQAGIYRDQASFFGHIVSHNPEARDAHLNLGQALIKANRPVEALAVARIAVKQRPDYAPGYSNVGLALLKLERFHEAETILRRGLEIDPRHKDLRQNLGESLRRQKRYREAAETYRAVLKTDSRYAGAYAGLGDTLYHLKRYEEAAAAIERSLSLEPDSPMAGTLHLLLVATHQTAAELLRKRERYEEAIESYRAALTVDGDYAPAHAGLGHTLFAMKRYEEALVSLTRSLTLQPHSLSAAARHVVAGQAAYKLNRVRVAEEHFDRAMTLDPRNTHALDHLAMLRFSQKRYEEALAYYRKMLEMNPDDAQTHSNLGATLYHLGRFDEARRGFERALALAPDLAAARTGLQAATRKLKRPGQ